MKPEFYLVTFLQGEISIRCRRLKSGRVRPRFSRRLVIGDALFTERLKNKRACHASYMYAYRIFSNNVQFLRPKSVHVCIITTLSYTNIT